MNAGLGRVIVNTRGILNFLKDMAHPEMKKEAWLRNVFANIWHFTHYLKKIPKPKTLSPFPFKNFSFLCLFPPNIS